MKRIAMGVAATALAVGGSVAMTAPAQAAGPAVGPIAGDSLVNVQVSNVLNNVSVTVPVQVAANVCDVSVAVLTETLAESPTTCEAGNKQFTITDQVN